MRDLMIVVGLICALAGLGLSVYDYLERRAKDEKSEKTDEE